MPIISIHAILVPITGSVRVAVRNWRQSHACGCVRLASRIPKQILNEQNCWKINLLTTVISISNRIQRLQSGFGYRISPVPRRFALHLSGTLPTGCIVFQVSSPNPLTPFKIINKLPIDFLESVVQTVHTAERGTSSGFLLSSFNLLLRWARNRAFLVPSDVASSKNIQSPVVLTRSRIGPSS